ncbi:MAG TPA: putative Ig domain-containing protein [Nocardioides sp.]|nr:putative Ig domain-containing protein [Nocardioides sp.]
MLSPATRAAQRRSPGRSLGRLATAIAVVASPLAVVLATTSAAHADDSCGVAGNLVADCGFESVNGFSVNTAPPGWTLTSASSGALLYIFTNQPRSGAEVAWFGSIAQQDDTLSQDIAGTTPGASYTASFWSQNAGQCGGVPTHLAATVTNTADGTATLVDQTNTILSTWTQYSVSFTAGASAPTLHIGGYDQCGYEEVDDVAVVQNGPALPSSVPGGTYDAAYTSSVAATGGTSPYTYAITAGSLPAGLTLDGTTGAITGTPTAAGDATFTVTATDAAAETAEHEYTLSVAKADPTLTVTAPATGGVVGQTADASATSTSTEGAISYTTGSTACSVSGTTVTYLHPGSCVVEADQAGSDDYNAASSTGTVTVTAAATTTTVHVHPGSITADVAPVAPGAGHPSGTVTFSVGSDVVGTAPVTDGSATLDYDVPTGATQQVAAVYSGDSDFTGSSDSTSRQDPVITARVTSTRGTTHGWYRTPVRITFTCATHGADLTAACPAPVTLSDDVAGASVTRTILATDGGAATVVVSGIDIDRTEPTVRVAGIRDGAWYGGKAPDAHCVATDRLSGVASCRIARHARGALISYAAIATDRAGNTSTVRGSYHVLMTYLVGAPIRQGVFQVGPRVYSLVTHASSRPRYVDAAPAPAAPHGLDNAFTRTGRNTWALTVSLTDLPRNSSWNLGVLVAGHLRVVHVRVR